MENNFQNELEKTVDVKDALKMIAKYADLLDSSNKEEEWKMAEEIIPDDKMKITMPKKMRFLINLYFKIWNIILYFNFWLVQIIYKHLIKVNEPYADVNWLYEHVIADGKEYHSGSRPDNQKLLKSLRMDSSHYDKPIKVKELEVSIDADELKKIERSMECFQTKLDSIVPKEESIEVNFEPEISKEVVVEKVITKVREASQKNKKSSKKKLSTSKK